MTAEGTAQAGPPTARTRCRRQLVNAPPASGAGLVGVLNVLRGSGLSWRLDLRVCAAQRLMLTMLLVQQVWWKWMVGLSPVGVRRVEAGHEFAVGGARGGEVVV